MRRLGWPVLSAGGLLGLLAASRPWWQVASDGGAVSLSGGDTTAGLANSVPLLALIGVVLAWTLRTRGRRILGGVLALAGLAMGVIGGFSPRPSDAALLERLRQVSLAEDWVATPSLWGWVYLGAGLLVAVGGVLLPLAPDRGARRFEPAAADGGPADGAAPAPASDAELWKALDAGVDPTAEAASGEPISPNADSSGTMGRTPAARPATRPSGADQTSEGR